MVRCPYVIRLSGSGLNLFPAELSYQEDDVQNGPGRQQRLLVFGVEVHQVPGKLVFADAAQHLHLVSARIDGLHARSLPSVVQVRLER